MEKKITSLQNEKIKQIVKFKKTSQRKKQDIIIVEGRHEISLAQSAGIKISELFYCDDYKSDKKFVIKIEEKKVVRVSTEVFQKISGREKPDGYLALAQVEDKKIKNIKIKKNPLVLVLEAMEKPGNLGAILRTADAVGVDVVLVSDPQTDLYNPNVIRASLGTVFTNQVVCGEFEEINNWLQTNKIKSFAATPSSENKYTKEDYSDGGVAILVGTEHEGLSEKWLNAADKKIKIPMQGKIDSLNASVSAAVVLFEVARQRRG